ncbi:penicillin-binding transpeptidase domain-containing protein [Chitinophaga alhagiae]|uniref:penicillin-binding transpeptidase domain-containing protein n=1 Tax=Chitinophaga alhagiae TaxID=2203219 RepID=UPI000E5BC446|nr:penicillin-binding transpeptidase domain-containing protein [Chitinophaga alhagiae]
MQRLIILFLCCRALAAGAQHCNIPGNTVIYNYRQQQWTFTDSADALVTSLPASTFKVVNLLIALETGVIKDEMEVVKWPGHTDTTLYGYRPSIYKDMTVKEAFEVSAGWVFMELSKKIGKERYRHYLTACRYGNGDLSRNDPDFWNYGPFEVSPRNQVEFLVKVYEEKLPFSKRSFEILKRVMITESKDDHVIRSKTGWTRVYGNDYGWWVGYLEKKDNVYFFATRLVKDRKVINPDFSKCRRLITIQKLKELKAM